VNNLLILQSPPQINKSEIFAVFKRFYIQSRTQSNACARARMALALGKLNFSCAVIGLTFINRACRQRTGTPKFRGSGCQFPQSQCHPSPRTGIALGTAGTNVYFEFLKISGFYSHVAATC
jgi:hypothetical protein